MAIQISENKLSPKARKALANAKSKSQFLRDALEFYVSRDDVDSSLSSEISPELTSLVSEIKELKSLMKEIATRPVGELVATKEVVPVEMPAVVEETRKSEMIQDVQSQNAQAKTESVINPVIREEDTAGTAPDGMSEEEKKRIEDMLSDSLNMFG